MKLWTNIILLSCALAGSYTLQAHHVRNQYIVPTSWVNGTLAQFKSGEKFLLIDVRPQADYKLEHIPHAINIPTDLTFGNNGNASRIGSPSRIRALFSKHGIRNDHSIVLYDNGLLKNAARFFWVLETYGHKRVAIVNGGFADWKNNNYKVSTKIRKLKPSDYIPVIQHKFLATKLATRLAINDPGVAIIDSRVPVEYQGTKTKASRAGHIPSAINIPWYQNLEMNNPSRILKNSHDLLKLYQPILDKKQVITYCNRGKESAVTYFVLRMLGYQVSSYDGAWLEWGNDLNLPITPRKTGTP